MQWFQKKKPQQTEPLRAELSPNFAEDLMYLELEIESPNVNMETIQKLLQLYGQAVEYFSSIKDDKYLIFMNKSKSVLLRSNVSEALNMNSQTTTPLKKEFTNTLAKTKELEQDSYAVQRFLHNERNNQEKRKSLIENEFSAQDSRLAERMLKRVKDPTNLLKKSTSLNTLQKLHLMAFDRGNFVKSESVDNLELLELHNILEEKSEDYMTPNKSRLYAESGMQKQSCRTEDDLDSLECSQFGFKDHEIKFQQGSKDKKEPESMQNDLILPTTSIEKKEKKIREIVNNSKALSHQKSQLLQKNNILPF